MKACYCFVNSEKKVIYVGSTVNLKKRMREHFLLDKGHCPKECYAETEKVFYIPFEKISDARLFEVYYYNQKQPKYNRIKDADMPTLLPAFEALKDWQLYAEGDIKLIEQDNYMLEQLDKAERRLRLQSEMDDNNIRLTDFLARIEISKRVYDKIVDKDFKDEYLYKIKGLQTLYITDNGAFELVKRMDAYALKQIVATVQVTQPML